MILCYSRLFADKEKSLKRRESFIVTHFGASKALFARIKRAEALHGGALKVFKN